MAADDDVEMTEASPANGVENGERRHGRPPPHSAARTGQTESGANAGIIKRIRVENFMCHDSFSLELDDRVNFITGQNGSGKSAFLTALCVAFGIKAKGTQRASSLKDFIKNGQSYGGVIVEIRNEGGDAFKPDVYGKVITLERRLTQSGQSFNMKDERGRNVAHKREDLQELLDHFNIEVENPCVIMTQDKSREFLHSGSGKDKFKFFFKATLLQQVEEVLNGIKQNLESARSVIEEINEEMRPFMEELTSLEDQIKNAQFIDQLIQRKAAATKKLAWAWVYQTEKKLEADQPVLDKWRARERRCQDKITKAEAGADQVREAIQVKSAEIQQLVSTTGRLKNSQQALDQELQEAIRQRAGLQEDMGRKRREIDRNTSQLRRLEGQVREMLQKHAQHTQAEAFEREQQSVAINQAIESKKNELQTLKDEEVGLGAKIESATQQVNTLRSEIDDITGNLRDVQGLLRRLQEQRQNQMTTFGGSKVINLLQIIEQRYREFSTPPIGPIGNHVTLVDASWSLAIEVGLGQLLDAFIVANQKDVLLLRQISRLARYDNLRIITYDFNAGPLVMRPHQLPDPSLVTVKSVLQTENVIVMNTLIDQGSVERQVLVADYEEGKAVVFDKSPLGYNVKEALTKDGSKMFIRGGSETFLPKDHRGYGRLGVRVDDQMNEARAQAEALNSKKSAVESRKRSAEDSARSFHAELQSLKRRRLSLERAIGSDEYKLRDLENAARAEAALEAEPDVRELEEEIAKTRDEIQSHEDILVKMQFQVDNAQVKVDEAKASLDKFRESARTDMAAFETAEQEMVQLEEELNSRLREKADLESALPNALAEISRLEARIAELSDAMIENREKAILVCPEEDVINFGEYENKMEPENWSRDLTKLNNQIRREQENSEPLEELLDRRNKMERKVMKKQVQYKTFMDKIQKLDAAYKTRQNKYERTQNYLQKELQWRFSHQLKKKGFSGKTTVDYANRTLKLEVQMPQDASGSAVKDTRALSGGERSFSTLSFALALHYMTEAPFRAMDEFDVFMDAVSRKISLEMVVDFAVSQGSQWIFITPHDISTVKKGPFVRKQEIPAPRP
ncbi:hypothetical protein M758_9G027800 [Ceratodon purpureus]|nr:hypothetical protein M758_9G027800 [Ceratodon purpureus]